MPRRIWVSLGFCSTYIVRVFSPCRSVHQEASVTASHATFVNTLTVCMEACPSKRTSSVERINSFSEPNCATIKRYIKISSPVPAVTSTSQVRPVVPVLASVIIFKLLPSCSALHQDAVLGTVAVQESRFVVTNND